MSCTSLSATACVCVCVRVCACVCVGACVRACDLAGVQRARSGQKQATGVESLHTRVHEQNKQQKILPRTKQVLCDGIEENLLLPTQRLCPIQRAGAGNQVLRRSTQVSKQTNKHASKQASKPLTCLCRPLTSTTDSPNFGVFVAGSCHVDASKPSKHADGSKNQ